MTGPGSFLDKTKGNREKYKLLKYLGYLPNLTGAFRQFGQLLQVSEFQAQIAPCKGSESAD
ncbi:MAG: hypothetical protein AAGC96_02795 [Pseudomonadota bacterium]